MIKHRLLTLPRFNHSFELHNRHTSLSVVVKVSIIDKPDADWLNLVLIYSLEHPKRSRRPARVGRS